jgi:hypothetical protein
VSRPFPPEEKRIDRGPHPGKSGSNDAQSLGGIFVGVLNLGRSLHFRARAKSTREISFYLRSWTA